MRTLISIIMPVYNCEEFIEESIRSIYEQTYTNWELIIVNDASEDSTVEKISQIQDERIHVINLREHQGITSAFAEGYKFAKGDFIIRHDGDDISLPTRLEIQQSYLQNNPKIGMVSCLISCFTRDQSLRKDCIFIERIQNHYKGNGEIEKAIIAGFLPVIFPTLMIRKELMDKVIYDTKTPLFDDQTELLLELIKLSPVEKVNTILYSYRRHKDAYHVVNQKEYVKYTCKLLKDPSVRNCFQFKEFYKDLNFDVRREIQMNENSKLRVLMLIDALNVGGTETHVLNITKKLMNMGIYVVVATSGGPMEVIMKSYGIKVIKIPIDGDYISNKKKFGRVKILKTIIDKEKINVIHCHLFASMQLASELYRMYKIPYVVTIHGLFYPGNIFYSTCIQASKVIAVSKPVGEMLYNKLGDKVGDKIVIIPNGISRDLVDNSHRDIDIRKELDIPKSAGILCYCSRLDWNKTNVARVLLFSFSQLLEEYSNLHVIIVGDGPGRESLEKEAQVINEMSKKDVVHMVGAKVDVIPYYLQSSIIIGTARVALEGMMCGKPVIAIGNQGYTGIVTESTKDLQLDMYFGDHDAVEKPNVTNLVKDIRYLLRKKGRVEKIGKWGRSWCEKMFDIDNCVKEIVKIYINALNK
ncbi:glycosyltransferase [Clostridium magnum]|uniref:Putative glycosyltransferase EpsE n=1 Tax=Clostridium magnum DSM 2767 TaxID=1121326 RepID=A0A161YIW6_9CLOT|nr:glycosyltransferase [Clostridium magnum]KZL90332.1 putative glycosyltransferase EpsE [Clostridium magnum DSM 2767]SHH82291.1 Glycosyltransferase involved in cell wall bisynthesis [Clostridium magnum DSM 2767]